VRRYKRRAGRDKAMSRQAAREELSELIAARGTPTLKPPLWVFTAGWTTVLVTCPSDDVKVAPDIYAQTLATYYQNQSVTITGERSGDGIFSRVVLPDGRLGWMKTVCVGGAVQPVAVDVIQPPVVAGAGMLVHQGKGRACDRLARAPPGGDSARQRGLARAEIARQADDIPGAQHLAQQRPDLHSLLNAMADKIDRSGR
jgi:hypothetical protein